MARLDYFDDPDAPKVNSVVPSVTAAVLNDEGHILLIHKVDNDLWALPGGETKGIRWVAPVDLDKLNIHPTMRRRMDHALDPTRQTPYLS